MQTFVPLAESYRASLEVLDQRRLNKQRVEALQIYNALIDSRNSWHRHPAVAMWQGCDVGLLVYGVVACQIWKSRGFNDTLQDNFMQRIHELLGKVDMPNTYPWWWGDERVHSSHRASLLAKDAQWYGRLGWTESPKSAYYWPTKENAG